MASSPRCCSGPPRARRSTARGCSRASSAQVPPPAHAPFRSTQPSTSACRSSRTPAGGSPAGCTAAISGSPSAPSWAAGRCGQRLAMTYQGPNFPPYPSDSSVYALLVVDDSTQRAQGVLLYEGQRPPKSYPQLGTVSGGDKTIPLYGVRVDWPGVSNPHCPLLGSPAPAPTP